MDILKRIGGLIKVYRKRVYLALALQLIVIVTLLLAPYITRDIVNQVISSERVTLREQAVFFEVHWARRVYSPLGIQ